MVALGYEPCCVPAMQLVEAAAGLCDLLWMIDTAVPGRGEMAEFLNRFGPVVDLEGMSTEQAVKTLAAGMRVGALAPDGIIEAIESTDPNWFCIGVQWHPESDTASALDMQLFECFVQAAVRNGQPLAVAA